MSCKEDSSRTETTEFHQEKKDEWHIIVSEEEDESDVVAREIDGTKNVHKIC